jgi:hypothetical protein
MSSDGRTPSSEAKAPNTRGLKPWRKGQSGNPNGRRGKGPTTAERLRNALADDLPEILRVVVENAKKGDPSAVKIILERTMPLLKAIEVPAILEGFTGETLTEQGKAIIQAMAQGVISPGQTSQLLGALASQAKIAEVDDLARRLASLEEKIGTKNGNA